MNSKLITTGHCTSWEWADFYITKSLRDIDVSSLTHKTHTGTYQLKCRQLLKFDIKKNVQLKSYLRVLKFSHCGAGGWVGGWGTTVNTTMTVIDSTDTHALIIRTKMLSTRQPVWTEWKKNVMYVYLASTFDLTFRSPCQVQTTFNPFDKLTLTESTRQRPFT